MDYGQRQAVIERIKADLRENWDGTAAGLLRYLVGQPEDLRRDIYALYWRTGLSETNPARRQAFVELMLQQTSAETPLLRGQLLKWLQDFSQGDFDERAAAMLAEIPWTSEYAPEIIRVVGIAAVQSLVPKLKSQVSRKPLPQPPPVGYQATNTWAALLALARMGDDECLTQIIEQVRNEHNLILRTSLFADLGYTRRPAAFDALRTYLNSDQRLPPIKSNVPGRLEACYAATAFAEQIKDFPIQETDFTEQQVMEARRWVNAQTEWHFK